MPSKAISGWYVHLQGEALGPLATEKLLQMLMQNRVGFADFAWCERFTKWVRISEIDEFAAHLPEYPKIGIPSGHGAGASPAAEAAPAPQPEAPKPKAHEHKAPSPAQKAGSRFLRVPLNGKLVTSSHETFEVLNIAERGVFVRSNKPLDIGTELQFKLEASALGEPLQMRGVVIRHGRDGEEGFAVEFTRLNPIHKNLIEQYVRKKSQAED